MCGLFAFFHVDNNVTSFRGWKNSSYNSLYVSQIRFRWQNLAKADLNYVDGKIEMAIIAKNQDDGLQILEQILPNFHPSLNVSIEVIDETHEERDIAIVLNGVGYTDDYEGDYSQRRTLIWTLNFTVKTYLFGPVDVSRDIRKITLDYRTDIVRRPAEVRYTAEVESTDKPPKPKDEIDPSKDNYKVVEKFEDLFGDDQDYFGLDS